MDAYLTNSISDAILSIYVLLCIVHASWNHYKGNNKQYSGPIIAFLISLFICLSLAALGHYFPNTSKYAIHLWTAFGVSVIFVSYCLLHSIKIPQSIRTFLFAIILVLLGIYFAHSQYIFVALAFSLTFLIGAWYSHGYTRLGLAGILFANVLWILGRFITNAILGYEVPGEYRYDNDIYHVLLVICFLILYKSINRGEWSYS